ncbi:MBL fold metallo-hydrolase [Nioella halotolerans]|uniref:MBL fold metallo-hydrolase n=1 Tax=Nioella halotolerans TaxID=2303578 RepID=UPI0026B79807
MTATLLEPGLRRITAPNPSPMTLNGTNTFLVGDRDVAVIDPGPMSRPHLDAILGALGPEQRISHILVTHAHLDHSPLARPLAEATGAPVMAAGPADWGRAAAMQTLAEGGLIGGGEGLDQDFTPDITLRDGEVLSARNWRIEVLHTPGHMAHHLSYGWAGALFCGDLVMGWSTSLISPPDGDLSAFRASLGRLMGRDDRVFYPAHGEAITAPRARCRELLDHRDAREAQILAALAAGAATPQDLASRIYTDIPAQMLPVAERNVLAHLVDLVDRNIVNPEGSLTATARFSRC